MKKTLLFIAAAIISAAASAKVSLPHILSDNMVLQQKTNAALWGTAKAGTKVTITPSWSGEAVTVKAGRDGKWSTTVSTPEAGGPYTIEFNDGEALTLKNVFSGEVWFCSGQSNMSMRLTGNPGQPIKDNEKYIMSAKPSVPIRIFSIPRKTSFAPEADCNGSWKVNSPENAASSYAIAYLFAREIQETIDVPVGIICSAWGGSAIEAWLNKETLLEKFPAKNIAHLTSGVEPKDKYPRAGAMLFNGMVAPAAPFTFKGIVWYQGEANRSNHNEYAALQTAYVEMMRKVFNVPEAYFYCVQIAPYNYNGAEKTLSGYLQEAQLKSVLSMKNAGIATTVDVGEPKCIHPSAKVAVSHRLAMLALTECYGMKGIVAKAPVYTSMKVENGNAILSFNTYGSAICSRDLPLEGFEAAGADKVFHKAEARVNGKNTSEVIVKCKEVPEIVAVRYCFHNYAPGFVTNNFGVPLGPFRTDDWPCED